MTNNSSTAPINNTLSPAQFAQLRDVLARYCGVYLDEARRRVIEQALMQRLVAVGESAESYIRRVSMVGGKAELQHLAELALNHETYFFRNAPQIEALRSTLLPVLHRTLPPAKPLRIWSAGCATGEEAYSLAICAYEALGTPLPRPVEIWATDLSEAALRRAGQGRYAGRAISQVNSTLLERYFSYDDGAYLVGAAARRLIRFEQLNLLDTFPDQANEVDIIFCQNVTIYFQLDTCRNLIDRFYQVLPVGGMLFLGFSETLWQIYDRFQLQQIGGAFVYIKRQATVMSREPLVDTIATPVLSARRTASASQQRVPLSTATNQAPDLVEQAQRLIEQGQSDEALEMLGQISPVSAGYPAALALVARIHADRGDLDMAVAEARRAVEVDPLTEEAYLLLGLIHLRQQQATQAIIQLERARYLNRRSPLILFHLAEAYRQSKRHADAQREYGNVLRTLIAVGNDQILDGVSVGWLRETCKRYLQQPCWEE